MKIPGDGRRTLCAASSVVLTATALLSACSTHVGNGALPGLTGTSDGSASRYSRKLKYTGQEQTFKVPQGVTAIKILGFGAGGGGSSGGYGSESLGGAGGRVKATLPVTPGEELNIFVGGQGSTSGGYHGGGDGGSGGYGGGGGGASDVRQGGDGLADRVIVAGGGGGGGGPSIFYGNGRGGAGGGSTGGTGGSGRK
jgi:hypothetical protein